MSADIHELAGVAYDAFERRTRDSGEAFVTLKDGAPEWIQPIVQDAHGEFLPDDWRYECIRDAFGAIHDGDDPDDAHEFADRVDIYTSSLTAWLASHAARVGYCDEAQDEGIAGEDAGVVKLIQLGQYMERQEIFAAVAAGLRDYAEELDDAERLDGYEPTM